MDRSPGDAQGLRLLEHLLVPRRLVVGVEKQVGVALDQAGKQSRAGEIDGDRGVGY